MLICVGKKRCDERSKCLWPSWLLVFSMLSCVDGGIVLRVRGDEVHTKGIGDGNLLGGLIIAVFTRVKALVFDG